MMEHRRREASSMLDLRSWPIDYHRKNWLSLQFLKSGVRPLF
jgi:hypothetical protein